MEPELESYAAKATPEAVPTAGLTGSALKLIAICAMLIDHIAAVVLNALLLQSRTLAVSTSTLDLWWESTQQLRTFYYVLRAIGRLGFPLFAFLLVEGFFHTRSRLKYGRNLALFALVSEIPFNLCFNRAAIDWSYQNVFFTLLLGLITIAVMERLKNRSVRVVIPGQRELFSMVTGAACGAAVVYLLSDGEMGQLVTFEPWWILVGACAGLFLGSVFLRKHSGLSIQLAVLSAGIVLGQLIRSDYGGWGVLAIGLFYLLRDARLSATIAANLVLCFQSVYELPAFLTVILIHAYNGRRGKQIKYLFYAFYPVHLLLLWGITVLMGIGSFQLFP